ncbi:MAG: TolC family protein [Fibrella sp.]|nr:TolC family protein [Armatimonadota bacterium]
MIPAREIGVVTVVLMFATYPLAGAQEATGNLRATTVAPVDTPVTLTRTEAIRFALAHSPLIQAAEDRVEAAGGNLQSAAARPPLQANLSLSVGGETASPVLTQVFETSGRRGPRTAVARNQVTAAERDRDVTRLNLVRDVSRAYYDFAQSLQSITLFEEVVDIVRRTRDTVRKQVDVGTIPSQDLVKAETELARAESDVTRMQAQAQTNSVVLNTLLGRDTPLPLTSADPLTLTLVDTDQTALMAQATKLRPEIALAEARIAAARETVRLQRADYRPDLGVSLLQNTSVNSGQFLNPSATGVGVSLAFPLFDAGRIRGRVREAEALVREQESLRTQARLEVIREVGSTYAQVKSTETLAARYNSDILPRAQDLLSKAQFGYERGGNTLVEYLEAQRTYRNTRAEYLGILGDNARARAELERATGQGLPAGTRETTR